MIPKIIHYCWFGKNEKPLLAVKCLESWKRYCPDFEIKEWNENNYDVNFCEYSHQAYEQKKWAFVSDVARYKILYENGGFYFDTDVEVLKPIENLLNDTGFLGFEQIPNLSLRTEEAELRWLLNPGLGMGAEKGNLAMKMLLEEYYQRPFQTKENICHYSSDFFYRKGMKSENIHQNIFGIHLYPKDFFNPMNPLTGKIELTENTVSIHHYAASWTSSKEKRNVKISRFINRFLGKKIYGILISLYKQIKCGCHTHK